MTSELTALALSGLLQALQFFLFSIPANVELGTAYTSSPRDTPQPRPLSILTGNGASHSVENTGTAPLVIAAMIMLY